jgi:CHASE3 domain sensor protein
MEIAQRQYQTAADSYDKGDAEAGKAAVEDIASYCERAGAAAQSSGKHLKHLEIHVRDLQRKLEALQQSVSYEDREPLKAAVDRLEKTRSDLLSTMFRKKS